MKKVACTTWEGESGDAGHQAGAGARPASHKLQLWRFLGQQWGCGPWMDTDEVHGRAGSSMGQPGPGNLTEGMIPTFVAQPRARAVPSEVLREAGWDWGQGWAGGF